MVLVGQLRLPSVKSAAAAVSKRSPQISIANRRSVAAKSVAIPSSPADNDYAEYKCSQAFFFPGQGAQSVGMAKAVCDELPAAKELFERASGILGYDLLAVCADGPAEKLNSTAVSQPALYVAGLAAIEKLKADAGQDVLNATDVTAGLSLGEYTALTYAGALQFDDGLKLVKLRGESMQAAADAQPSSMVSVIGLDAAKCGELCQAATKEVGQDKPIKIANYLCKGNYACSGSIEGCDKLEELAKDFGARMTVRLAVAGAFHTQYMQPAYEKLSEALANTNISKPSIPVVSNVDAKPHSDPEVIRQLLALQLTSPVQFETSMANMIERGMSSGYELGPGKVIAGLMKRTNRKIKIQNITV